MIGKITVNRVPASIEEPSEEEEKDNSVPGFSALTLIGTLMISGLATRDRMGRV